MKMTERLKFTPTDLSGIALIILFLAQYFSYELLMESNAQEYINVSPWYEARKQDLGSTGGRSSTQKIRLQYTMRTAVGPKYCDVIKVVAVPVAPILSDRVKVTPKAWMCEDPYITDREFWPWSNAYCGFALTALASAMLLGSAARHRRRVMDALGQR